MRVAGPSQIPSHDIYRDRDGPSDHSHRPSPYVAWCSVTSDGDKAVGLGTMEEGKDDISAAMRDVREKTETGSLKIFIKQKSAWREPGTDIKSS